MTNPEISYLEQSRSWKEGMQYRFSPDFYPITEKQFRYLKGCGQAVGTYLNRTVSENILEFRLDMVKDYSDQLWITEIQTDDRGMPAMAIARNARGSTPGLPGLMECLNQSFSIRSKKDNYTLAFIYPDDENFYYTGLYDVRNILRAINPESEIVVSPISEATLSDENLVTSPRLSGLKAFFSPDFIWDFTNSISSPGVIQTQVNKNTILRPWQDSASLLAEEIAVRKYIPRVQPPNNPEVLKNKDNWVLKPIDGRWSRGVIFGRQTNPFDWQTLLKNLSGSYIAQQFIEPPSDWLEVSSKKTAEISKERFISRIEPYFVKIGEEWVLADILATCTKFQPIHGSRDCIMIPAKII